MRILLRSRRVIAIAVPCLALVACMSGSRAKEPAPLPANQVGRPVLSGAGQATSLQSSIMALTDTAMQRIGAGLQLGRSVRTPEERHDDANTRLLLATALISIAIEPDPVDSLADLLTHTTLTADAERNAAKGKSSDSPEAMLLTVLEQNDADAWKLADRWLNEPTRAALREHILAWKGPRTSATSVAFVRLSDFKRAGSESVESGEGLFDTLHAATEQADQVRLLAERSIFLIQRMPFLLRWQAEVYTASALATKEAQQTQIQIERMSQLTAAMSEAIAGMSGQLSRERQAALEDLFGHVATERNATLEQVMRIVQQERKTTLAETGAELDRQREALLKDVLKITDVAGRTGSAWIGRTLLVGGILIAVLLVGLLGVMLTYRRLLPIIERRAVRGTAARPQ
jgi:hypothetical protein